MEGCAIGACANVCSEAAKGIFQEIKRHMRYVFVYKKHVDKFEGKMKSLIAKRQSAQLEVAAAERNVEKIKPDVKLWCDRVDRAMNEDVKKVKDLEDKAKHRCFFDLCPNIKSRYQLSKKAEEGAAAVDELLQQGGFDKVGYRDVPEAPEAPKNFRAFDSRKEIFGRVIEALKNSTVTMIGVYGTGGVGKTTLVNEVARRVQEDTLFDWVAKATVTRTPNFEKIQDEIAESLRLELKAKSIPERASLLLARLKQEKILVVLDNIWAKLDLEQVGIPSGDQQEGSKILLTSRNRDVLTNEMDAKKAFPIDVLNETEAWNLFKETAENDFEDSDLRPVATEVAKKCEGLPVAIVTVARALRNKDIYAWKDASLKLQSPSPSNFRGIPAAVYSAIELSYNYLESEEHKQTFLLCGLLGHNARVEDLVRYGMGLRLFDNVNTVEDTRNRVLTLVSDLKAFCLLRDSYSHDRFDMHDFDCDVALAIASRDNHAFALKHKGVVDDWPDEEMMRKFRMFSLSFDSVEKLPHELECPLLDFFCMGSKDSDVEMPVNFFQNMGNLKVLDLTKMKFSSISLPTSLRTLCLNQCVLGDMINLEKLKNLEIFSLFRCSSVMLTEKIGQLTKLRLLDLCNCYKLIIPAGVLSSLSKLEELYIGTSFVEWDQGSNARLAELKDLSGLTTLNVCIPDANIVTKGMFSEKLQRYNIRIGSENYWFGDEYSRALELKLSTSIDRLDDGVLRLLKKTEALHLTGLKGVKIVFNNREGFLHLKHLHIEDASKIQYIMNDNDAIDRIAFHQLRSLKLRRLPELISFCSKSKSGGYTSTPQHDLALFGVEMGFPCLENLSLSRINVERIWPNQFSIISSTLTNLSIWYCDNLKHLLSSSMARSLAHLKSFDVMGCKCLREIIFTEDKEDMRGQIFPKLELLKFRHIPNLVRFCYGSYCEFPLLKDLIIVNCPTFETFISNSTMVNDIIPSKWPSLKRMQVYGCDKVEIFASENFLSFAESTNQQPLFWVNEVTFPNLEELTLEWNGIMKEIWHGQLRAECDEVKEPIVFSRLKYLKLSSLPTLVSFCLGDQIFEFPTLEKMIVTKCPKMNIFCQGDLSTPQLQKVISKERGLWEIDYEGKKIEWWEGDLKTTVKRMFEEKVGHLYLRLSDTSESMEICRRNPQGILAFKYLEELEVYDCSTLKCLFTLSMALSLPHLCELIVKNCIMMEHIIIEEGPNDPVTNKTVFRLPWSVTLESCANLASFYRGSKILECSSLKVVKVVGCPKMFAFAYAFSREKRIEMIDDIDGGNTMRLSKGIADTAFFDSTVAVSGLFNLIIEGTRELRKIWDDKVTINSFCNLKYLTVKHCERFSNIFPFNMMKKLENLEILKVENCDLLEEIIGHQGLNSNESHAVSTTEIRLLKLPELTHLLKEEILLGKVVFNNLKFLKVLGCGKLKNLVSSSVSFKILTSLEVSKCHGLMNLVTLPTAKSMVLLRRISITDCQMLEEIISSTSDEVMDGIIFSRLESLEFGRLESLSRFCSGNYMLGFPSLEKVIVRQCPKMEIFCKGELSTPKLQGIQSVGGEYVGRWEGNLNATIQQLFIEKVFPSLEDLEQSSINIQRIWHYKLLAQHSCAQNLTCLTMEGCHNLNTLFSTSMVESFVQLKMLKIENCENVEKVVLIEGLANEEMMRQRLFRRLEFLLLKDLPRLTRFCHGNYFEFPLVRTLRIEGCPTLKTFISDAEGNNSEIASPTLFNEKVKFPCLEELSIVGRGNWRKIWHVQSNNSVRIHFANN